MDVLLAGGGNTSLSWQRLYVAVVALRCSPTRQRVLITHAPRSRRVWRHEVAWESPSARRWSRAMFYSDWKFDFATRLYAFKERTLASFCITASYFFSSL